ncbi:hypothetical protein HN803_07575 [candidate division WWE3 bacterium]|nr:hypothetical protein [candidate division WWE3 bacterium]
MTKIGIKTRYDALTKKGYTPISDGGSYSLPKSWKLESTPEVRIMASSPVEIFGETNNRKWCLVLVEVEDTNTKEVASVRVPSSVSTLSVGDTFTVNLQANKDGSKLFASLNVDVKETVVKTEEVL